MQQLGASFGELLIPPPTPTEPYPPLPMELDDEYIYVDHFDPQPAGTMSKLTGFNLNIKVYATVTPLATMELAYGIDNVFDWNRQKRVLEDCLQAVKRALDDAPLELMLQPTKAFGGQAPTHSQYYPPMPDYPGHRSNGNEGSQWLLNNPEARRHLQFEIQKANIYVSQLGTRSYIVEKYWNLQESYDTMKAASGSETPSVMTSPGVMASGLDGILLNRNNGNATSNYSDSFETYVTTERESVVKDLLRVLSSISQVNMEPNGASFVSYSHPSNCS
jgi:hypothetical protein